MKLWVGQDSFKFWSDNRDTVFFSGIPGKTKNELNFFTKRNKIDSTKVVIVVTRRSTIKGYGKSIEAIAVDESIQSG